MTPDDRKLIGDLFARMRDVRDLDKDRDAETFIHDQMRGNADSPYLLVQSVLAQEHALQQADQRISELEGQLADREQSGSTAPNRSAGFGATASVPPAGPAPWQAVSDAGRETDKGAAQNGRSQAQRGGGSFMQQAMTTAAGVAGGMLLASGISSLLGSGTAQATEAGAPSSDTSVTEAAGTDGDVQTVADDASTTGHEAMVEEDDEWGGDDGWSAGDGGDWGFDLDI